MLFFWKENLSVNTVVPSLPVRSVKDALLEKVELQLRDPQKKGFNDLDGLYNEVCLYLTDLGYKFQRGNTRGIYWVTSIIWSLALSDDRKKQFEDYLEAP